MSNRTNTTNNTGSNETTSTSINQTFARTAESVWYSQSVWTRALRCCLLPFSGVFRAIVAVRNFGYDLGLLQSVASSIPVISIGNISVGGTGKTPVAAFIARKLIDRGYRPAIVMRGYGNDEPKVHALLSPTIPVYANPDRIASIAKAVKHGATAIVLDDAFQHRYAERDADFVLVSAERWRQGFVLPAGPLREPRRSLRRAALIIITHRTASSQEVERVMSEVRKAAPHVPVVSLHLRLDQLVAVEPEIPEPEPSSLVTSVSGASGSVTSGKKPSTIPLRSPESLSTLAGVKVLAIAGVGDPDAFFAQLRVAGAQVDARSFPDHYAYTSADVERLVSDVNDHKYIVTTLKDAVKLRPLWASKGPPLWYVSQAVEVSSGATLVEAAVNNIFPFR